MQWLNISHKKEIKVTTSYLGMYYYVVYFSKSKGQDLKISICYLGSQIISKNKQKVGHGVSFTFIWFWKYIFISIDNICRVMHEIKLYFYQAIVAVFQ